MATKIDASGTKLGFIKYDAQERLSSDKLSFFVFIFFLISVLGQASLLLINWGNLPPEAPIFYSRSWGEPMLAAPIFLWILPALTVVFALVNYFIALYFFQNLYFLRRVLVIFSAIISFATLYGVTKIIGLLV